jgi:hypothetical protein
MFELFNDIYFVVYKLYYIGQNNNLGIRVSLKNWDRGSKLHASFKTYLHILFFFIHIINIHIYMFKLRRT